jgi:uncharacterized repeat protein (TIGR02543 family)
MRPTQVVASWFERKGRRLPVILAAVAVVAALLVLVFAVAAPAASSFPDVPPSHPYYAAITDLATRGIIGGYQNGNFGPADPVQRQQFAKMIVLTGGYPASEADVCPFTDVPVSGASGLYPDNYIAVCAANGITMGKTATSFAPYGEITRLQVISMVVRLADKLQPGLLANAPIGILFIGTWPNDATHGANARRAIYNGLAEGIDLTLPGTGAMPRGEVAQVLHNLLGKLQGSTGASSTTTTTSSSTTSSSTTSTTTYSLSTSVSPAAGGTVTRTPNQVSYAAGTSVVLAVSTATGYVFMGWSGDASGTTNPLTVVMDKNKTITASFSQLQILPELYSLTTSVPGGGGTIKVSSPAVTYQAGTSVTLTAVPNAGWAFSGWGGDASGTANPLTVVMSKDKTIAASFTMVGFEKVGGVFTGSPAVCSWGNGRLDVFVRGTNSHLMHRWYSNGWSNWEDLGGELAAESSPAAVSWGPERIDVFVRGMDNELWRRSYSSGSWGDFSKIGGGTFNGSPTVCSWGAFRLDFFVRNSVGALVYKWIDYGSAGDWKNLGGVLASGSSPAAEARASGRLDVLGRGQDNELWANTSNDSGATWTGWTKLGGVFTGSPGVCSCTGSQLDLFVRNTNGHLMRRQYYAGSSGGWLDWQDLGGDLAMDSSPGCVSKSIFTLDVFVRGTDNELWHKYYDGSKWKP